MIRTITTLTIALAIGAGMTACEKKDSASSYQHPSDATRQADGTYRYADGSVHNADGSLKTPAPSRDTTMRDTSKEKPTKPDATSQSNAQADLDVTQAIRKAVQARDDISAGTKGTLVIVTEKGTITLKGPVASDAEKTAIGEIAASNASGRTVDNQLAVKTANAGG